MTDTPDRSTEGLVGKTIDGLEVRALLGRGGMAEVYKAWDPKLERLVALKIISEADAKDREYAVRFEREARAVSGLSHPNIAHVYATGRLSTRPYYVMEYVDGRSLADVLEHDGRLSGLKCLDYLRQAVEGLRAAWERGERSVQRALVALGRTLVRVNAEDEICWPGGPSVPS